MIFNKKNFFDLDHQLDSILETSMQRFSRVVVACSAGLDSTVLLHLLAGSRRLKPCPELIVAHVNFHLRGAESQNDEIFVRNLASSLNLPIEVMDIVREGINIPRCGIQNWARKLRYQFFQNIAGEKGLIATAHHADDLAENTMLRLARGASVGKLAGMTQFDNNNLWRPFLYCTRAQIEAYARQNRLSHRVDSSNVKMIYGRNMVRHTVLSCLNGLYPNASLRICQTAFDAQEIEQYFLKEISALLDANHNQLPRDICRHWPVTKLGLAVEAMARRSLAKQDHTSQLQLNRRILGEIHQVLKEKRPSPKSWQINLPEGLTLSICAQSIRVQMGIKAQKIRRAQQHKAFLFRDDFPTLLAKNDLLNLDEPRFREGANSLHY